MARKLCNCRSIGLSALIIFEQYVACMCTMLLMSHLGLPCSELFDLLLWVQRARALVPRCRPPLRQDVMTTLVVSGTRCKPATAGVNHLQQRSVATHCWSTLINNPSFSPITSIKSMLTQHVRPFRARLWPDVLDQRRMSSGCLGDYQQPGKRA